MQSSSIPVMKWSRFSCPEIKVNGVVISTLLSEVQLVWCPEPVLGVGVGGGVCLVDGTFTAKNWLVQRDWAEKRCREGNKGAHRVVKGTRRHICAEPEEKGLPPLKSRIIVRVQYFLFLTSSTVSFAQIKDTFHHKSAFTAEEKNCGPFPAKASLSPLDWATGPNKVDRMHLANRLDWIGSEACLYPIVQLKFSTVSERVLGSVDHHRRMSLKYVNFRIKNMRRIG